MTSSRALLLVVIAALLPTACADGGARDPARAADEADAKGGPGGDEGDDGAGDDDTGSGDDGTGASPDDAGSGANGGSDAGSTSAGGSDAGIAGAGGGAAGAVNPGSCTGDVVGCTSTSDTDFTCTLDHDGRARTYRLHVPASYTQRPATGAPIVFAFHGLRTTAAIQEYVSGMKASSDDRGFVLVYPEGVGASTDQSWNAGTCCGTATAEDVDDVGFTTAMLERIGAGLCIDDRRVYATGFSNGGHMAYRLACERADVFAAIASVAGLVTTTVCEPSRPVPVLHFHGTADAIVTYDTGIDGVHGAERVVADWVQRDACSAATTTTYAEGDVTCVSHLDCAGGAAVELCTIDGGGHQWPGGQSLPFLGHTTSDVSATDAIGDFFAAHALP